MSESNPILINICGNIASGKSTLAAALIDFFGYPAIFENTDRISLFNDYCKDTKEWATLTQLQFLSEKISGISGTKTSKVALVDRSIHEDYHVFTSLHWKLGNISTVEYEQLGEFYSSAISVIQPKEVNILVCCSRSEQERRIRFRSKEEQNMLTPEYLSKLDVEYAEFEGKTDFDHVFNSETHDHASVINFLLENLKPSN